MSLALRNRSPFLADLRREKLRSLKARTVDAHEQAISEAIATITPHNASAWFAHCDYDLH